MNWRDAKPEERQKAVQKAIMYLRSVARKRKKISYKRFVNFMNIAQAIQFTINDFHERETHSIGDSVLDRVTIEENKQGRGLLSVVVVSSSEPRMPDIEFFKLAKKLGKSVNPNSETSKYDCFSKESEAVYVANSQQGLTTKG